MLAVLSVISWPQFSPQEALSCAQVLILRLFGRSRKSWGPLGSFLESRRPDMLID